MPRVRRNEWNFAANAASLISELLRGDSFVDSAMGHAEPELTELRGARRLDLVIFSRADKGNPLITGELKVPWDSLGRTPYNTSVVQDAYSKAGNAGALYFITWNIRRVVVWKTDEPGVQLIQRVVYDKEIISHEIENSEALARPDFLEELRFGVTALLEFLSSLLAGSLHPHFLPVDRIFIARLEAALDHPISATTTAITERMTNERTFRLQLERWMRDVQGWLLTPNNQLENITRASRFTCYVLVNRLCFYNALRRKYQELPRLTAANSISTSQMLNRRLQRAFSDARRFTGDYESVFDGDFGDTLPFIADASVPDWRELIRLLDSYDFAHIDVDVIGAMYERLITPAERHRYGQHYTQPRVVDLMTALSIRTGNDRILDPGCGGGTFLVGAYKRKSELSPELEHSELLSSLYGCDILQYACHLTTINLAIRDLIDDDNFPRVHLGNFLAYEPGSIFSSQPVRMQAGGLPTGVDDTRLEMDSIDVVIGNPPYINAKELSQDDRKRYLADAQRRWPTFDWKKTSDIYLYFWLHSARFLCDGGRLAFLTQSGWLDGDFGIPLQEWMMTNFEVEALIETEAEPWFTDARVATAITVLRKTAKPAVNHTVKFVQLNGTLADIFTSTGLRTPQALAESILSGEGLPGLMRVRTVAQTQLDADGRSEKGSYTGSRWGRHLRTPDGLYELYSEYGASFTKLSQLADVVRGITTNCDDFFLVEDITAEALTKVSQGRQFREFYGITRQRVVDGEVKIVMRKDGVHFALLIAHLQPILKTARDFQSFSTNELINKSYAICFSDDRRNLGPLAEQYIAAGEREGWHRSASFATNRKGWFALRTHGDSPLLFPKTSQYIPAVIFNDGKLLANQRLYEIRPLENVDALALWAVLNSTLFAFERYTAAKSLGREAAIDIEVFTAEALRVPDVRSMGDEHVDRLIEAARALMDEQPAPALDEALMEMGQGTALDFISRTTVGPDAWPRFMTSESRQSVDLAILESLGIEARRASELRTELCNELLAYTRKLKILEFQAQENRRGTSSTRVSGKEVAGEVLQQILSDKQLTLRRIPTDFIPQNAPCREVLIPVPGRLVMNPPDLFSSELKGRIHNHELIFDNLAQSILVGMLSKYGLAGTYQLPTRSVDCEHVSTGIETYILTFSDELDSAAAALTSDVSIQSRVLKEGMNLILHNA